MTLKKKKRIKGYKDRVYSLSQMNTYIGCGRRYKFRYIDKIKGPRNDNLIIGSAHHNYFEDVLKARMESKDFTSKQRDDIREDYKNVMSIELEEIECKDIVKHQSTYDGLTKLWDKEILPGVDPIGVEEEVWYTLPNGCKFIGYLDLINNYKNKKEIIDWKVVARKKSDNEVKNLLQLAFYSLVTDINHTGICSLTKTKKPAIHMSRSYKSEEDKQWCLTVIQDTMNGLTSGYFPVCSTENFLCCEKYCDYWNMCRGKVIGKQENELNWAK